jgi:hypothetical protein
MPGARRLHAALVAADIFAGNALLSTKTKWSVLHAWKSVQAAQQVVKDISFFFLVQSYLSSAFS